LARVREKRNAYRVLVRKPEGKRLEKPRRRWEDNINIDLLEMGHAVAQLVEALCYKPEGHGFKSR
jgi:hypothetical protein